jgi:hypothetical protein
LGRAYARDVDGHVASILRKEKWWRSPSPQHSC